jgi:CDP-2,3-bis-(O-geranylgeranyl)-sn-glycerol synthase
VDLSLLAFASAIYYILPAYFANATPTIFKGKKPVDFNRHFIDGKPIFGAHKTIRGFLSGLIAGSIVAIIQKIISLPTVESSLVIGLLLTLGALIGDLTGAFIKRRVNIPPGEPFPLLDQLDFVFSAFIFASIVAPPKIETVFFVVVITPLLHILTNFLAFILKIKDRPF